MQRLNPFPRAGGTLDIAVTMPSSTRHGADTKVSVSSLPPDVLQRICSFLEDPDDLASCHVVDTRYARLGVQMPRHDMRCRFAKLAAFHASLRTLASALGRLLLGQLGICSF